MPSRHVNVNITEQFPFALQCAVERIARHCFSVSELRHPVSFAVQHRFTPPRFTQVKCNTSLDISQSCVSLGGCRGFFRPCAVRFVRRVAGDFCCCIGILSMLILPALFYSIWVTFNQTHVGNKYPTLDRLFNLQFKK